MANLTPLNPNDFSFETYSPSDESLINSSVSSCLKNSDDLFSFLDVEYH